MPLKTALTELLEIEQPIILAPMARVSGGALAAAVSAAGGLGLIGGGYGDGDWIDEQFDAAGNQPVGLGFITWSLAKQPALLDRALAHGPRAVMLSFGDISPFADKILDSGAKLICQVQTVAGAKEAAAAGASLIVAQGCEAGGHSGTRSTLPLVPAVVDAVAPLPVVAAGGIGDGRGLAAALSLGACGVLMGTRFYATQEALVHDNAKNEVAQASGDGTRRSDVFDRVRGFVWPKDYGLRSLDNDFLRHWQDDPDRLLSEEKVQADYQEAYEKGDTAWAAVLAGEVSDIIRDVPTAREIVERMVTEAEAAIDRAVSLKKSLDA